MLPFIFFALYEKDGQPAEKILGHVIKSMFLRDKVRPYRTNNLYAAIQQKSKRRGIADCTAARKRPQSLSGLPKTARCTAIFSPPRKRRSWSCRRKRTRRQRKSANRRSRPSPMWRCAATASARSAAPLHKDHPFQRHQLPARPERGQDGHLRELVRLFELF